MKSKNYAVKCITNLHMGSGDINFSVIDNEVQRDPVLGVPTMFASGVKGALRSHFEKNDPDHVVTIFGSPVHAEQEDTRSVSQGQLKFLNGILLLLPVRAAKGPTTYFMVTSKKLLQDWADLYETLTGSELKEGLGSAIHGMDDRKAYVNFTPVDFKIELTSYASSSVKKLDKVIADALSVVVDEDLLAKVVVLPEEEAQSVFHHLPVLARNKLDNGISNNLWYEEVVPHEAVFSFSVLADNTAQAALDQFAATIKAEPLVQFGGHATVGNGLTELKEY